MLNDVILFSNKSFCVWQIDDEQKRRIPKSCLHMVFEIVS